MEDRPHSLLPVDSRFIRRIADIQSDAQNRGFYNQPIIGDPYEIVASNYSFSSTNVLQTTADEINRWQKGDRILITQAGTDKTFFVVLVNKTNNRLILNAGNVYTFTNDAIERIQVGPVRVIPPGFPASYTWAANLSVPSGSISNVSYTRRDFTLLGDTCTVYLSATFDIGGGGTDSIILDLPIQGYNLGSTASTFLGSFLGSGSSFTPQFAYAASLSGSSYTQCAIAIPLDYFDGVSQSISGKLDYKII